MNPSPEQALAALQNMHRPYRTHHAKVRDALAHAKQSQRRQSPLAAGFINSAFHTTTGGGHGHVKA